MAYLLDTDVLIDAKNRYYGFDVCPGFWRWIEFQHVQGFVFSVERVKSELIKGDDGLADWAKRQPADFYIGPDIAVLAQALNLTQWSTGQGFKSSGVEKFASSADLFLIATAAVHGHIIVTRERRSNGKKDIKIPDACDVIGVECVTRFEMLRRENARFVLG